MDPMRSAVIWREREVSSERWAFSGGLYSRLLEISISSLWRTSPTSRVVSVVSSEEWRRRSSKKPGNTSWRSLQVMLVMADFDGRFLPST